MALEYKSQKDTTWNDLIKRCIENKANITTKNEGAGPETEWNKEVFDKYFQKTLELMPNELDAKTISLCATYLIRVYSGLLDLDSEAFCQSTLVLLSWLDDSKVKGTGKTKISNKQQTDTKITKVDFIRSADAQGSPLKSEAAAEILQNIVDMLLLDPNDPESKMTWKTYYWNTLTYSF